MNDLGWLLVGNLAPAALGYLVVCLKDACSRPVDVTDEVGLCGPHLEELRASEPEPRA